MPNDSKLYLCFEYCDYDLKKYMKSCQYKLSANCIKVRPTPHAASGRAVHLPQPAHCSRSAAHLAPWQSFTYQMLNGLTWCHSHRIFHRCAAAKPCSRVSARPPCSCLGLSRRRTLEAHPSS